jgi:glycosyltransferase involved in cell wall biosynthesis
MNQDARKSARSLAGATILQVVPALRDDPAGRAAVEIAFMLLQSGARAIVAGAEGPLVRDLCAFGGEWLPMINDTINPLRIWQNARRLADLISVERVDIVHAQSAGGAWSGIAATKRMPVFLVTSFADRLPAHSWGSARFRRSLARGDRVIAPSGYVARAMIECYRLPAERITVIPRAIDTNAFDPATISADRITSLRRAWGVAAGTRVVLVPGRLAPWNGQLSMIDAARFLARGDDRNIVFIFAGDEHSEPRYARALRRQTRLQAIDSLCRFVGHCSDMPAAFALADVVVVPALEPPLSGRTVAEAQASGRPVVTTSVGMLPENVLAPPRMRDELRTGWLVQPGNAREIARAVGAALALDITAYGALAARARQFAVFAFSAQSVADAIRGVYTSLLIREG